MLVYQRVWKLFGSFGPKEPEFSSSVPSQPAEPETGLVGAPAGGDKMGLMDTIL